MVNVTWPQLAHPGKSFRPRNQNSRQHSDSIEGCKAKSTFTLSALVRVSVPEFLPDSPDRNKLAARFTLMVRAAGMASKLRMSCGRIVGRYGV